MRARTPHILASKGGQWEDYRRLYLKEKFIFVCKGHRFKAVVVGETHAFKTAVGNLKIEKHSYHVQPTYPREGGNSLVPQA
jgi:hypothetical protein